ncbi:competence/damage-inducible protein A [Virgibacillus proomii]|uniref:competence/damage-inducible protein A n=1 Tax=Virgibacillus proomii TaxID=84407 RepID=UPI001C0FC39E|nr:competence/damage-inducible protein A [Virgibacillus proomii]MBU5267728.1 competence/damage-inducible protein A [Virgibacillus proomii]
MSKTINAEIVAVGTELLLGQITNTNAQWLSQQLANYGINIFYHAVVGDNLNRVVQTFKQAHNRSNVIIVTGGLGPTNDDLTREAFQQLSQFSLVEHKPSMDKIQAYFKKQQTTMTPNNRKQASVFADAEVWPNHVGMAPGMMVSFESRTWIFLPGVPREMKALAQQYMFPALQQLMGKEELIKSVALKFVGIGESKLEHELYDLIHGQSNPTIAPLAQEDGIVIRLTAKSDSLKQADELLTATKAKIIERVGQYIYGVNHETLEGKVVALLAKQQKTIAAAESLTGGLFAEKLTAVSGASNIFHGGIVSYTNHVKEYTLGVSKKTLQTKGAISEECAKEMAEQIAHKLGASIGISFTGVAGPTEMEGHPVGLVYIGIYDEIGTHVEKCLFHGDRSAIRRRSVVKGLELLYKKLK